MLPEVSYVIVCYNSERYIRKCIESIKNQTHSDFEIIVSDNNSIDKTVAAVNDLLLQNKNIKLILNKKNLGYGQAINEAIPLCGGELIVSLNADVSLDPNWTSKLLNKLKSNEKIMALSGTVLFSTEIGRAHV